MAVFSKEFCLWSQANTFVSCCEVYSPWWFEKRKHKNIYNRIRFSGNTFNDLNASIHHVSVLGCLILQPLPVIIREKGCPLWRGFKFITGPHTEKQD